MLQGTARCCRTPSSEPSRMLTISKALSAGQAQTYHSREFASEQQNYWSRDRNAHSEWRGGYPNLHGVRVLISASTSSK